VEVGNNKSSDTNNNLRPGDRAVHDWFRFVLSFPPHLVREYLSRFNISEQHTVLDPFCGTGTTLVECKKLGLKCVGIEANPFLSYVAETKVNWSLDPCGLVEHAKRVAEIALKKLHAEGISDNGDLPLFSHVNRENQVGQLRQLPKHSATLLIADSICPLPLHKVLVLLETLEENRDVHFYDHERIACAKVAAYQASNLHFGPEVGVSRKKKHDAPVISMWLNCVSEIAADVEDLQPHCKTESVINNADARQLSHVLSPNSIDCVITSPPYPNEKDYTRTTRLESVLLGFISNKKDLRGVKERLLRSNTRSVFKHDDDDKLVVKNEKIQEIARQIEQRRIELSKTSGFERLYARLTKLYFGGMARHFSELRSRLRPGAQLAYVVGDQASYLRVMIRTGQLLAEIAESFGYRVVNIDLFRTRLSTATKEHLREEVVVLSWPG
jgi:16S rRNA G966 N2-methylase RsmD